MEDYGNPVFTSGGRNSDSTGYVDPTAIGNEAPYMSSGMPGIAGAGVSAAGFMASRLADIAGQKYKLDREAQQNDLSRASSEKMAKMMLASNQGAFDNRSKAQALQSLLAALGNSGNMAQTAHDTQRYASSGSAIMNAFSPLRRR